MRFNIFRLVLSLITCQLAGFVSALFTTPAISGWYATLEKPTFNPPNWIFSPVWIFLYLLMGVTLYILWQNLPRAEAKIALWFFALQLILNILWSVIFFGLKLPMVAFLEIIILWVVILLTIIRSARVSKTTIYLLLPYILWVNFAAILNFFLWRLNS
jgi:tryptophan-rich sensory protein